MAKTPTVHNPTHFDPAHYEVETYLDNKRPAYYGEGLAAYEATVAFWEAEMVQVLGADWRKKSHRCVHCGNGRVRWITAVRHLPTNDVVVFGSDCTARLGFPDKHVFKLALLQARDAARKVKVKVYLQREKFLQANPAFAAALETLDAPVHAKNFFAKDVVAKLGQYGSLSERQVTTVLASLARDVAKAAEVPEVKGNAPTGRVTVTGVVLSVKVQTGHYGPVKKMLVQLTNKSRVWLTVPGGSGLASNDAVTVTATFTPSQDDPTFAFGSHPVLG